SLRQSRKPFLFLLRSAEEFERLRNTDRLMGGEPGHRRAAPGGNQTDGAVVVRGAEAEAAVLLGDFHAPGAELIEAVEQRVVILAALVDAVGVDVFRQEALQPRKEGVGFGLVGSRLLRERMDEVEVELAEEKIAD